LEGSRNKSDPVVNRICAGSAQPIIEKGGPTGLPKELPNKEHNKKKTYKHIQKTTKTNTIKQRSTLKNKQNNEHTQT